MNDNLVIVIDLETTGFLKQNGKICEIGIVELCLCCGNSKIIFDKIINPEELLDIQIKDSWIVKNGYISLDEIRGGYLFSDIKEEVQEIINKYTGGATAYNRNFDFDFLESYGIKIPKKLNCPMVDATDICKLPGKYGNYKWPTVEEAYNNFFPDSDYKEIHRGADDALHEAKIVYEIHKLQTQIPL